MSSRTLAIVLLLLFHSSGLTAYEAKACLYQVLGHGSAPALAFWIAEKDHPARYEQDAQSDLVLSLSTHLCSSPFGAFGWE
jgi:hypothetical protein